MENKKIYIIIGIVVAVVLIGFGAVWFFVFRTSSDTNGNSTGNSGNNETLLIKSLPIMLAPYDPATQTVGDIKFTDIKLEFNRLYFDYGFQIPGTEAAPARKNPQPTFIAPLGTKVRAIVDGVVTNIPKLYSNDYSIMIGKSMNSNTVYEMEHVINPIVKVGDYVKAGDVVAEVSDYETRNTPGFGLVEMGILIGGNPPKHVCPSLYMDPSFKIQVDAHLESLYSAWNDYKGTSIYDRSAIAMPGCEITDEIQG